jgi:hypothetical protein
MPRVAITQDTLDDENRRFAQQPLRQPVFLNSVPKSGSHLLRNIVRMFVPVEQQYSKQFIQWAILGEHRHAFSRETNLLSWGHLFFGDASAIETGPTRRILLIRDPYDWVLARARFFLSNEFRGNVDHLRSGELTVGGLMSLMIFGIHGKAPALVDVYRHNAVAWLGTGVHVVRYEELTALLAKLDSGEAESWFRALLDACGIEMPADWRERVRIGSDRRQSGTARENLSTPEIELPATLPEIHRRQVDFAAPGLRAILGYG